MKNYGVYSDPTNSDPLSTIKTLRELLCKPKARVAKEDKKNVVYEIDFTNFDAVYFGESKQSLKSRSDEHKRTV